MTQVHAPYFGRAMAARAKAASHRDRIGTFEGYWSKVVAIAHKNGCVVVEKDGRRVPVTPKWLLPILKDGLLAMAVPGRMTGLRQFAQTGRRGGFAPLTVTRGQVEMFQRLASERAAKREAA